MQNLIGKNWEQRNCAAQKHGKQIESDRRENNFLAKNEFCARRQAPPGAFFSSFIRLFRSRNWQHHEEKQSRCNRINRVNDRETLMRDNETAERGSDD